MKTLKKLWFMLGVLTFLVPLGLIVPRLFRAGAAWGEWGKEEIKNFIGYIPAGLGKLSSLWRAPFSDYALPQGGGKDAFRYSLEYIISAAIGIFVIIGITFLVGKFFIGKDKR